MLQLHQHSTAAVSCWWWTRVCVISWCLISACLSTRLLHDRPSHDTRQQLQYPHLAASPRVTHVRAIFTSNQSDILTPRLQTANFDSTSDSKNEILLSNAKNTNSLLFVSKQRLQTTDVARSNDVIYDETNNVTASSDDTSDNKFGERRFPSAIIIGVKKGGTRALLEFLRIHPDIRATGPEPHFFDKNFHLGLDWYRSQMPLTIGDQLTIEKTPSYFITPGVPQRLCHYLSRDVRLIVVVRDPVTRALSDYAQTRSKRPEVASFDSLALENDGKNTTGQGSVNERWGAIRIGQYARHLRRWLKHFKRDQFHFVSGERLVTDPAAELGAVQDFLGLKRLITEEHFYFNSTKGFPCLKKRERTARPHCLGATKGRPHPTISRETERVLRRYFRPWNQRFFEMVGVDFGWNKMQHKQSQLLPMINV